MRFTTKMGYEEAAKFFWYSPETGIFKKRTFSKDITRLVDTGHIRRADGYVGLSLKGIDYLGHRVAWLLVTGSWPCGEIDHVNGVRNDNRFVNLRTASHAQNLHNRGANKNNKSGLKGVSFHRQSGKWDARIMANRNAIWLGLFDTPEEAHQAYCKAAIEYHGNFVNTGSKYGAA